MAESTSLKVWPALLAGVVTLVVFAAAGTALLMPEHVDEYARGRMPAQFYRQLEASDLLDDYRSTFAIAHNSGDSLAATREAIEHGADVIEVDVISIGGDLYAGHRTPLPILGRLFFRGPLLADVWESAALVEVIKLDLKESSPGFVARVLRFLEERTPRETVVVSPSTAVLAAFEEGAPHVVRVLSVSSASRLESVLSADGLVGPVEGVSVAHAALTEERVAALKGLGLMIFAFTVDDLARVNELVALDVDAITTDNLALMELLGGPGLGEVLLRDRIGVQ